MRLIHVPVHGEITIYLRKKLELAELYTLLKCDTVERVKCRWTDGKVGYLWVDENGIANRKEPNAVATVIMHNYFRPKTSKQYTNLKESPVFYVEPSLQLLYGDAAVWVTEK